MLSLATSLSLSHTTHTTMYTVQDAQFGYSGAKLALEAWAAGTAVADGPQGIRINCVRPGVTVTAVWDAVRDAMGAGTRVGVGRGDVWSVCVCGMGWGGVG